MPESEAGRCRSTHGYRRLPGRLEASGGFAGCHVERTWTKLGLRRSTESTEPLASCSGSPARRHGPERLTHVRLCPHGLGNAAELSSQASRGRRRQCVLQLTSGLESIALDSIVLQRSGPPRLTLASETGSTARTCCMLVSRVVWSRIARCRRTPTSSSRKHGRGLGPACRSRGRHVSQQVDDGRGRPGHAGGARAQRLPRTARHAAG